MSDQRSVATDALATLGTIIDDTAKRDAIHLAVIPAVAGNRLHPGQHVEIEDGHAIGVAPGRGVGIVDPFILVVVEPGQHFWLVIYPRQINSLRHVWTHPAFPDEPGVSNEVPPGVMTTRAATDKAASEKWLRDFCAAADCPSYEKVISAIASGNRETWDDEYLHFKGSDAHGDIPPEFWDHVEVVLGHRIETRPKYFSCSC